MILPTSIFKFPSDQFVPIEKTPWGGKQIVELKIKYLQSKHVQIPDRIGESMEAQTDNFLLKWIDAIEPLSIQVHPQNSNHLLKSSECGKSEAWFVYSVQQNASPVYLGFKEGYSQEAIIKSLCSPNPTECIYSFIPKKNDYISIPCGCVHSLGAGILVAEPQSMLSKKESVTWRIFDWNRRYNKQGLRDDQNGSPREINLQKALSAIDWHLPRGKDLEKTLVTHLTHRNPFLGNDYNPFSIELFTQECSASITPFMPHQYAIVSVFEGMVSVSNATQTMQFIGGESGFIPSSSSAYKIEVQKKFQNNPCALIFTFEPVSSRLTCVIPRLDLCHPPA